jgi:acyl-CoA thioesterase I
MGITLTRESRLLFIGDSITDCGRRDDKEKIGSGYPRLIRDYLWARDPDRAPVVLNTGISGNRVTHLQERWQRDVIDLKPDVLSIKIGINDVWHGLGGKNEGVPIALFIPTYRQILLQVRSALPQCQLVLCEPNMISPPAPADGNDALKPYVRAVNELAAEFHADAVVRLHGAFLEAVRRRPDIPWAPDGVHPSSTGHMLIAREWLKATGLL